MLSRRRKERAKDANKAFFFKIERLVLVFALRVILQRVGIGLFSHPRAHSFSPKTPEDGRRRRLSPSDVEIKLAKLVCDEFCALEDAIVIFL